MEPRPTPVYTLRKELLRIEVYATREEMGRAAAYDVTARIAHLLVDQPKVRIVFAAAPSQNEFLSALAEAPIEWPRIEAFHMDEYVGLPSDAPQRFGNFLRERLFDRVPLGRVCYIDGNAADLEAECARYAHLLAEAPIDIVCAGIGENGHMAFNDPHVADLADPLTVKPVTLDAVCRQQQVHDGAFAELRDVPHTALTLTMSALLSARWIHCVVPGPTKRRAVYDALYGPVGERCPASALRRHPASILYLDMEAAADLPLG